MMKSRCAIVCSYWKRGNFRKETKFSSRLVNLMNHENENSLSGYSRACFLTIEEDGDTETFMLRSE